MPDTSRQAGVVGNEADPTNGQQAEEKADMSRSRPSLLTSVFAITAAIIATSLMAAPANAAPSRIAPAEEDRIRATIREAGLSTSIEDRLISKLRAGDSLDSELSSSVPISSVETQEAAGMVTTRTYEDGSIRTTVELSQSTTGPSNRVYVAHPTLECNLIHCTLIYSKADTAYMATGSFATVSAIIAAACGPAAWACGIATGIVVDMTKRAHNAGRCIALQKVISAGPPYPVIVNCRK